MAFDPRDSGPTSLAFPIVPHDTNPVAGKCRGFWVGTGGTIVVRLVESAQDVTLKNVGSGTLWPFVTSHIRATGTTASDIVGFS